MSNTSEVLDILISLQGIGNFALLLVIIGTREHAPCSCWAEEESAPSLLNPGVNVLLLTLHYRYLFLGQVVFICPTPPRCWTSNLSQRCWTSNLSQRCWTSNLSQRCWTSNLSPEVLDILISLQSAGNLILYLSNLSTPPS
jgi:hypothetical protein